MFWWARDNGGNMEIICDHNKINSNHHNVTIRISLFYKYFSYFKAPSKFSKMISSISYWQSNQLLLYINSTLIQASKVLMLSVSALSPPPPPPPPPPTHHLLFTLHHLILNTNSTSSTKYPAIAKFISDNDTDLFAISEAWIRPDTTGANLCKITPPCEKLARGLPQWRPTLFGNNRFDPSIVPTKTFENFLIKISLHKESFHFLNIYRPPSSTTPTFFKQFQSLLKIITQLKIW